MKKIIFTIDFLFHDWNHLPVYHNWILKLIRRQIFLTSKIEIIELKDLKNNKNKNFDRKHFFQLSNIENIEKSYFPYKKEQISQKSINYLKEFLDGNTILLGCELGLDLRKILTKNNITYINSWFHPYKLFDDIIFLWGSNNKEIYKRLQKHQIEEEKFYFYTSYWKVRLQESSEYDLSWIKDNSLLFVGQTMKDKSIEKDGKMLNITDFKDKIKEFSKKYSKVYYAPHPLDIGNKEVNSYISNTSSIQKIIDIPSYNLLSCDKITKVVAISSSMVYEAQFFEKETEYLYQPLFKIDEKFSLNTFISVYNEYLSPKFWADILEPIIKTNKNVPHLQFDNATNKIRDIRNLYWGYRNLDKLQQSISINNNNSINTIDKQSENNRLKQIESDIRKLKIKTNLRKRILNKLKKLIKRKK